MKQAVFYIEEELKSEEDIKQVIDKERPSSVTIYISRLLNKTCFEFIDYLSGVDSISRVVILRKHPSFIQNPEIRLSDINNIVMYHSASTLYRIQDHFVMRL